MLKNVTVVGWGLGSLGLAVILNTFNVLLLAYLTLVVGIDPALAGSLVLATKLYDVATDLPMGWLTDRTRTRWGKRRPYLFAAGLLTPLSLVMLFSPPAGDAVAYVTIALLLYATGYTLFNVPYLSMPAEMSLDTHVRTRMVAWRSLFIAGGTMFGVALAPFLVGRLGRGAEAYQTLGVVMAITVAAAFIGCVFLTGERRRVEDEPPSMPIRRQLATIVANPHFRSLMMIKITHLLSLSIGAGSLVFFFLFALGYDLTTMGVYGAVKTVVWALTMPLWTRIAGSRGKRFGYFVGTAIYSAILLSWMFADSGEPMWSLHARAIAFGFVSGGLLLMGNAMLQDIMDDDYRRTQIRKNGMFAGSYSLTEKITSGIGAQVLGLVLAWSGFDRTADVQSDSAIQGIFIAVAVIPAALMIVSLWFIHRYRLDEFALTESREPPPASTASPPGISAAERAR